MKKIIFRADGNRKIGMGHFVRTLALADILSDFFFTVFAIASPDSNQKKKVLNSCNEIIELQINKHYESFLDVLFGEEIVVLDNYYFNSEYQKKIKKKGCYLVCIDDMHDKHYYADIVINHFPGVTKDMFSCEPNTKLFLGLDYLLLRKPFLENKIPVNKKPGILFICFGGSDYSNLTLKVLKACIDLNEIESVNIVIGSEYQKSEELNAFTSGYNNISVYRNVQADQMASIMLSSSIAVVPCSGVLLEAVSCKLPVITGYYVDNQKSVIEGFRNIPNIVNIGNFNQLTEKEMTGHLRDGLRQLEKIDLPADIEISSKKIINIFKSIK